MSRSLYTNYENDNIYFSRFLNNNNNILKEFITLNRYAILKKFEDLSNNELANLKSDIIDLQKKISDLSSINLSDISNINLDFSFNKDLSFNAIKELSNNNYILNLKQLNEFIIDKLTDLSLLPVNQITTTNNSTTTYVNDVSQTFYEIMTQQPYKFSKDLSNNSLLITTSSITLYWNYDSIIAKYYNQNSNNQNSNNNIIKLALFNNDVKNRNLPYIDYIQIDISGTSNIVNESNTFIPYTNININDDYNAENYKNIIINKITSLPSIPSSIEQILSSTNPFDIRIYGVNNAANYPTIENRALIFSSLAFNMAQPPSQPFFITSIINNNNSATLYYDVSFIEDQIINSNAKLKEYYLEYNEIESLASIIYQIDSTINIQNISFETPLSSSSFNVILTNLKSGTNYNHRVKVKNDLNDLSFSLYSNNNNSNFTRLPNSNNINSSLNLSLNSSSYTNVTNNIITNDSNNLNNSQIIYLNLYNSIINPNNNAIIFNESNFQTIEISYPYSTNQQLTNYGYGKFIDNSLDLVNLKIELNNVQKQEISFDGSFSSNSGNNNKYNSNNFNYINLQETDSLQDIWLANANNRGFRLKGILKLNNIKNSEIAESLGDASTNPYILTYTYSRNINVNNNNNQTKSYYIYIDDLSINPSINLNATTSIVNDVIYNFGIPSVLTFKLEFNRTYNNINSQYNYIIGNNIIASISSINNINTSSNNSPTSIKYIELEKNEIKSSGNYIFDETIITNKTNNYYNSLYYSTSLITNNYTLSWTEKAYSLLSPSGINKSINHNTNHYCDYNSFNNTNNKIISPLINLSNIKVYEISNIELFNSNLEQLELIHYNDHNKQVKDCTLLHINGKFQSNIEINYPNIEDYSYNNLTITNNYNHGLIGYDLSGIITPNNGYKWIVFEIKKLAPTSGSYVFNNITYNIEKNDDDVDYLNLSSILSKSYMFNSNTVNNIFSNTNYDALGFVKVSRSNDNKILLGNLKTDFNPVGNNWNVNGSPSNISFNNFLISNPANGKYGYGAKVIHGSNFGIYLSPTALNDDLTLFIGLKNN